MTIEQVGMVGIVVAAVMWRIGGFTRRMLIAQVVGLVIFVLMLARAQ